MMFQRHLLSHIWLVWVSIISVGSSINNQFIQHFKLLFREIHEFEVQKWSSWWLNQPIWKICSSNRIISPGKGENKQKYLKTPPSFWKILNNSLGHVLRNKNIGILYNKFLKVNQQKWRLTLPGFVVRTFACNFLPWKKPTALELGNGLHQDSCSMSF